MKKTDWKYLVDVLMFLSMIRIILLGLLMDFAMKSGRCFFTWSWNGAG